MDGYTWNELKFAMWASDRDYGDLDGRNSRKVITDLAGGRFG